MSENEDGKNNPEWNRREFIRSTSLGGLMLMAGCGTISAQDQPTAAVVDTGFSTDVATPVACAVIGCGVWGREILNTLALLENEKKKFPTAPVVAVCDTYKSFLNKAKDIAPGAEVYEDYKKLLEQKNVEAVIVATPSHLHKDIVLAALAAGKHVYCEAPLAHTIEDARAIAQAASAAFILNFQTGLQARSDPKRLYILNNFIRVGALGQNILARSQSHQYESWLHSGNTEERVKEVNWRLHRETSPGLMGELGVHQLDLISWFLNKRPTAVSGFGGLLKWNEDDRDVPDTVQAVFEYPGKVNYIYDATLANSFGGTQDIMYGSMAAVMMTAEKSWLFKESSSDNFGWEIYATKESLHKESGIVLSADATKSVKTSAAASAHPEFADSPLNAALKSFIKNSDMMRNQSANFIHDYGNNTDPDLKPLVAKMLKERPAELRAAGYQEGFEATMCALKANEAILKGQKIMLTKDMFEI